MPMYRFRCNQCRFEFEDIQDVNETVSLSCPRCLTRESSSRLLSGGRPGSSAVKLFTPFNVDGMNVTSREQKDRILKHMEEMHPGDKFYLEPVNERQRSESLDDMRHKIYEKKRKVNDGGEALKQFTKSAEMQSAAPRKRAIASTATAE